MRPLEACLLLADALTTVALFDPRLRSAPWMRVILIALPLIALAQGLLEGPRWQLTPAYAYAVVICAIGWRVTAQPAGPQIGPGLKAIGMAGAAIALFIAVALPAAMPIFRFPKPRGPYGLGTLTYHWQDSSRSEPFSAEPNARRELMVQVWYPALDDPSAPRAPYMQDADVITPNMAKLFHVPAFLFSHFRYVMSNAVQAAPVATGQPAFPVLIYLSGLGGGRQLSMFQIEELVSKGYIVAGIDQPGASAAVRFPDGRIITGLGRDLNPLIDQSGAPQSPTPALNGQPMPEGIVPYFAKDASFALDELAKVNTADPNRLLAGRLDLDRVGLFGVSLGAIAGSQACADDPRFKACLLMDGFVTADALRTGLRQPAMWITRPADTMRLERQKSGGWAEKDIAITIDTMRAAYDALPGEGYYVEMPAMFHINFTDAPYYSPVLPQLGMIGPIDRQRGFDIVNAYSLAFFDKVLKGKPSATLEGQTFPEAHLESRKR